MVTGRERWVPDELATAGRENLDPAHVDRYDRKQAWNAADEVAMLFARGLRERATVVDLGAGTGRLALEMAGRAGRVVAVDVSPVMLERLAAKLELAHVTNVECVRAGFLSYEHAGPPADLVYSRYALHHLPDFWKAVALARIARFLAADGILRLWDVVYRFEPTEAAPTLERWMDESASASVEEGWTRGELEEHIRDESSTFTWLLEPMITRAGFVIEQADYSDDQIFASYLCRRRSG